MAHAALVSTPFGVGTLREESEIMAATSPALLTPQDTSGEGSEGFAEVLFPWGHAYLHKNQIAPAPEFTFYAFAANKRIIFTMVFPLNGLSSELIKLVREKLAVAEDIAVTLLQTDSVNKHELLPDRTIGDCIVGSGPQHPILVLQSKLIRFDPSKCSNYVLLQHKNATAVQLAKGQGSIVGTGEVTVGVKYWEVKLESARFGEGVYIGVGPSDVPLNGSLLGRGVFWGISCATGHKVHDTIDYYTDPLHDGDVIGVLLDMERGNLTFYKNGRSLGLAFSHIAVKKLSPVFTLSFIGQSIRLLSTATAPIS